MNKKSERKKVPKNYYVPPIKVELAFMKQQEILVKYVSSLIYCLIRTSISD